MKRLLLALLVGLALAGVLPAWGAATWNLIILHTNDMHGKMVPYAGSVPFSV